MFIDRTLMFPLLPTKAWLAPLTLAAAVTVTPLVAHADGQVVDRVYDPYVQPLEKELEWRTSAIPGKDKTWGGEQIHHLGLGRSFSDRWFGEVYLIGARDSERDLKLEAIELEAKYQLTEQGEYAADWGLLFELEHEREENVWEAAATLISSREWGRWTGTANLAAIYEWGDDFKNEWESELRMQARYRWLPHFEPGVEFYAGQDYRGIGPIIRGEKKLPKASKLMWELGVIQGLTSDSPDQTFRLLLEYEFF
ncbi:hypothetical protein [Microbulbifer mangrovi]|uniref:hypothetical protein n=1 Tax=Microbulbifer mangrovi TaxID=927787 RepID=UPI00195882EA|nr:hypothetical protein [Microbulbifer mangrovi]